MRFCLTPCPLWLPDTAPSRWAKRPVKPRPGMRAFRLGIRLRRLRNRIAEQAPSPGGNLPSDRYLTHDFYSLRRWTGTLYQISKKNQEENEKYRKTYYTQADPLRKPLIGFPMRKGLPLPRQALLRESKPVPLSQAVGHIAAGSACPCPPGVPVVMPGERITKNLTEFLYSYGFSFIEVVQ